MWHEIGGISLIEIIPRRKADSSAVRKCGIASQRNPLALKYGSAGPLLAAVGRQGPKGRQNNHKIITDKHLALGRGKPKDNVKGFCRTRMETAKNCGKIAHIIEMQNEFGPRIDLGQCCFLLASIYGMQVG
jgi:hypothetical protein